MQYFYQSKQVGDERHSDSSLPSDCRVSVHVREVSDGMLPLQASSFAGLVHDYQWLKEGVNRFNSMSLGMLHYPAAPTSLETCGPAGVLAALTEAATVAIFSLAVFRSAVTDLAECTPCKSSSSSRSWRAAASAFLSSSERSWPDTPRERLFSVLA